MKKNNSERSGCKNPGRFFIFKDDGHYKIRAKGSVFPKRGCAPRCPLIQSKGIFPKAFCKVLPIFQEVTQICATLCTAMEPEQNLHWPMPTGKKPVTCPYGKNIVHRCMVMNTE
jgi:hypothetical protein